jgi:hypothetical protein
MSKYLQLWELIIQNEKAVESLRQKLHKRHRFDIRSAFELCDMNRDGGITAQEVIFHSPLNVFSFDNSYMTWNASSAETTFNC